MVPLISANSENNATEVQLKLLIAALITKYSGSENDTNR
jgi:hypothetical protein